MTAVAVAVCWCRGIQKHWTCVMMMAAACHCQHCSRAALSAGGRCQLLLLATRALRAATASGVCLWLCAHHSCPAIAHTCLCISLSLIPSMYLFSSVNGPAIMTVLLDPSGPSFSQRLIRVEHTGGVVWCSSRMATTCAADTSGGRSRTVWPTGTHTILSLYLPLLSHTH